METKQRLPAQPRHPGRYIKEHVLPADLSVKDAAALLGVGRPALSNLLNENASLSPEMALRIEKAFGAKRDDLLKRQAEYDEFLIRDREKSIAVRAYARSAVEIQSIDIENWSRRLEARALLPALLRKLVHATGVNLSKADFPAYDNSQRKGWDGQVETDTATPWIPAGKSGWEFGCNENPAQKAEKDYQARTEGVPADERAETAFIFVTPKNWQGKEAWAKKKEVLKDWKSVSAIDASDLEQWLEQSVAAQCWLSDHLGIAIDDLFSLEQCWVRWASATTPELNKEMFRDTVESRKGRLKQWLQEPPSEPLVVTAASQDEALACLVCLFEALGDACIDRALVVHSIAGFNTAKKAVTNFVAIIASAEVEKILAGFQKRQHTIIVRNHAFEEGNRIVIDLPGYEAFKASLSAMGFSDGDVDRYASESGYSPTILRRRLSHVPAIKSPPWTQDTEAVRRIIPLALAGVWKADSPADQEILRHLADTDYREIERALAAILQFEQSPMWALDRYRGVISKIDALFVVSQSVTREDLERFFFVANYVLREDDPALDLPEDKRWAANFYGKSRDHSSAIREGLCETLVLLAVHGNNLFQERIGINVEAQVNTVVRELLMPPSPKIWLSQQRDLPRYAEAAPDEFLSIVEQDLKANDPTINALLRPADSGGFGGCPRTGLLWALELLAWKAERMPRVIRILAKLSERKIDDNWINKPESSLGAIFRSWMPQTAAPIEQRKAALVMLAERYPHVGWRICLSQFEPGSRIGHYSHRPRWRNDAAGAGQAATNGERYELCRKALDIALDWPAHDERTLGDLIPSLHGLKDIDQVRIWELIAAWGAGATDERKAVLRERIRRFAFTRRAKKLDARVRDRAREVYALLEPQDVIARCKWLFAQQWVEESLEEIESEDFGYKKRGERIETSRTEALRTIWAEMGMRGVRELCLAGDAAGIIGWLLARNVLGAEQVATFLHELVTTGLADDADAKLDDCIAGLLNGLTETDRRSVIDGLTKDFLSKAGEEGVLRLCRCAPFRSETWTHVDGLGSALRERYWKVVAPRWGRFERTDMNRLVDELVAVDRPRAAFSVAHLEWESVDSDKITRLLREVATKDAEPDGHYVPAQHDIATAFESLDQRADVPKDHLAQLEFMYVVALEHSQYGIPNIEREFAKSPQLFIQALVLTYKRSDKGQDPPEWNIPEARREATWRATYALLENVSRIPGTEDDGTINRERLMRWVSEARALSETYARLQPGDHKIGRLLSACPVGADGAWPCEPVRYVVEEIASNDIATGMAIGKYNARGATWREVDGREEKTLAEQYGNWSRQLALDFPFVSSMLESMARNYDHDAKRNDTDAKIRKRLRQ